MVRQIKSGTPLQQDFAVGVKRATQREAISFHFPLEVER